MEYRYLGSSGLRVSVLSLGSWITFAEQCGENIAYECMQRAYEAGVNFFDTAEEYADGQAELVMGHCIKKAGWKRSDLVISTKIFWGGNGPNDRGLSRKHILEGTNASLARLHLDYVDLIYCHRPDPNTPIEETARAMTHLVHSGKALYWGTSEWSSEQIREVYSITRRERLVPPTMEQPEYNMFNRERVEKEYARLYKDIGLGTTIYSPLACGLLTGKYNNGIPEGTRASIKDYQWLRDNFVGDTAEKNIQKVKKLAPVAAELNMSLPILALAWCAKNPNVSSVITGASRPEHVIENMKALDAVEKLTPDVIESIEGILDNKPQPETDYRL
jgi:voltage-dependent potassium channel beta subunit